MRKIVFSTPRPGEVRAARIELGLTQTDAAALLGCQVRAWQGWESGERMMSPLLWWVWRHWAAGKSAPIRGAK